MGIYYSSEEAIAKIEEANGMKYSEEQLQILKHEGGACVVSCAGSGKTTVITAMILKRLLTGEINQPKKLLLTTYSKAGADNMTEVLKAQIARFGLGVKVEASTLHAFYLRSLKHAGLKEQVCTEAQRRLFIRNACRTIKFRPEEEDLDNLSNILSFQINMMLTDKDLYNSYVFNMELSLQEFQSIRTSFSAQKREAGLMDFDDMQLAMYCRLKSDAWFLDYCRSCYDTFCIDEFQDTNKLQFEILKFLVVDPQSLIVIGDDDQCIYGWRGASPEILLNICAYYNIKKFHLSTNYRCSKNILKYAASGVEHTEIREAKDMIPYNDGGTVEFMNCNCMDLYGMERAAYKYISNLIQSGEKASDICVIVRNNAHAAVLSNMLLLSGIYTDCTKDIKISNSPEFKDIQNILSIIGDETIPYCYSRSVAGNMLWKLVSFLGSTGGNLITELMDNANLHLVDALNYICAQVPYSGVVFSKAVDVPNRVKFRIETHCSRLKGDTVIDLKELFTVLSDPDIKVRFAGVMALYVKNMEFTLTDPNRRRVFNAFFIHAKSIVEKTGVVGLQNVINTTLQYEKSTMPIDIPMVRLTTAHSSKGLEWKHVIVLAYDNISFPSFSYISSSMDKGVSVADIQNYVDGERRLAYVALTRAKKKLTIIGDFNNFSIFGLEAFGKMDGLGIREIVGMATAKTRLGKGMEPNLILKQHETVDERKGYQNIEMMK